MDITMTTLYLRDMSQIKAGAPNSFLCGPGSIISAKCGVAFGEGLNVQGAH
jgi:hypothetical protein